MERRFHHPIPALERQVLVGAIKHEAGTITALPLVQRVVALSRMDLRLEAARDNGMRSSNRRLDILVAEDNPIVAATLCRILTALGYLAVAVEDGQAAVDQALGRCFDVILMDVEMPRKDGITACREILTSRPESAVILMTGSHDAFELAMTAGAKAVVRKPAPIPTLRETIELAIATRSTGHQPTSEQAPPRTE